MVHKIYVIWIKCFLLKVAVSKGLTCQNFNTYLISFRSCNLTISYENLGNIVVTPVPVHGLSLGKSICSLVVSFGVVCKLVIVKIGENSPLWSFIDFIFLNKACGIVLGFLLLHQVCDSCLNCGIRLSVLTKIWLSSQISELVIVSTFFRKLLIGSRKNFYKFRALSLLHRRSKL